MIPEPRGYKDVKLYPELPKLPAGGYVINIMNVKQEANDWGITLVLQFDITEGQYAGFYKDNYTRQIGEDKKWKGSIRLGVPQDDDDEWKQRAFKSNMTAVEDSNEGYVWEWDETTLKGKTVGALFRNKEYQFNDKHGFYTECFKLIAAEKIRNNEFEIPADKLLKANTPEPVSADPAGFEPIDDDDIPF